MAKNWTFRHGHPLGNYALGLDPIYTFPARGLRHLKHDISRLGDRRQSGFYDLARAGTGEVDGAARVGREVGLT